MGIRNRAVRSCIALASSVIVAVPMISGTAPRAFAAPAANGVGSGVVVSELTNGGPGGYHDNFIEIANWGDEPVDVTGWQLFRCTGTGAVASSPQNKLQGTIGAGEKWVFARKHDQSTIADARDQYSTSFANESYGALLRDASGQTVDAVAVQFPGTASQACGEGTVLANITDSAAGESFQRVRDTDDNASDFVRARRTPGEANATEDAPAPKRGDVLISEVAHTGPDGEGLIEIANYGTQAVDISSLKVDVVNQFGRRFNGYTWAAAMPQDTLEPGEAVVVPRDEKGRKFTDGAAGVVLYDDTGAVWDRVAWADGQDSAAADGTPLPYTSLGAADGQSYQREGNTGNNAKDFTAAARTPGSIQVGEKPKGQEPEYIRDEPRTTGGPNVLISEMTNTGPGGNGDIFFELQNYGDAPQDLTGYSVYRCIGTGVRASVPQLSTEQLNGVVLEPGQRFTAGRAGQAGADIREAQDATFDISFATQYGLMILDPNMNVVDRVGSAREDVESFCANGAPLPGNLNGLRAESWQRIDITGDARKDFIAAPRTPGRRNGEASEEARVDSPVKITEVANGGPGGTGDNFVEITNTGTAAVDTTGWQVYRCTGTGRVYKDMLQFSMPDGSLAPNQSLVAARSGKDSTVESADTRYDTSFNADSGFGVMVVNRDGKIVDSVGVFDRVDSPCTQGTPLPNTLDFPSGESFQRVKDTGDNAADFVRARRTPGTHNPAGITEIELQQPRLGDLVIHEISAGPQYVEIINRGDSAADLSGLRLDYCSADGRRMPEPAAVVPAGVSLAPGGVFTVARPEAKIDGALETSQSFQQEGYGALLFDATGALLDRVAVYYDDVGAVTNAPEGPCSGEGSVPLDRRLRFTSSEEAQKHGYAWHRVQATGNNWADFFAAPATPGSAEGPKYRDVAKPLPGATDPVQVPRATRTGIPEVTTADAAARTVTASQPGEGEEITTYGAKTVAIDWGKSAGFVGASASKALDTREGANETRIADVTTMGEAARDTGRAFPYQRFELAVAEPEGDELSIGWTGHSRDRHELQLYLFNHSTHEWQLADAAYGEHGEELTMIGTGKVADVYRDGKVDVLVQDGRRTLEQFSDSAQEENQQFKTPGEYDFTVIHMTDSQYLTEQNPTSYIDMVAWMAANWGARDVMAAVHTGDVIQNWLRGDQEPDRATLEYERASQIMQILEDKNLPYGILPGNHDNVWGASNAMFNTYFPAERYEKNDWFGGHGPDGMASNYFTQERDGAKFLFLQMGYDSSDAEIDWAEQVIQDHPEYNVVFSTHEYLQPERDARSNPQNGRWTAQGDKMFERLIEPYPNVVLTLSGHLHGVRQRVLDREDGTKVIETVADYQSYEDDNARDALFTRLFQIDLDSGTFAVNAYMPRKDDYQPWKYDTRGLGYTNSSDEFVYQGIPLQYEKEVATSGIVAFGAPEKLGEGAGEHTWASLVDATEYVTYSQATRPGADVGVGGVDARYSALRTFVTGTAGEGPAEPTEPTKTEEPIEPGSSSEPGKCRTAALAAGIPALALIPLGIGAAVAWPVLQGAIQKLGEPAGSAIADLQQQMGVYNPQVADLNRRVREYAASAAYPGGGIAALALGLGAVAVIAAACGAAGSAE